MARLTTDTLAPALAIASTRVEVHVSTGPSLVSPAAAAPRRRSTATSSFGVGRRESHDASSFYARFATPAISTDDDVAPPAARDEMWVGDARDMDGCGAVADNSVALVVTSPPYYAGKEYEAAIGEGHVPASYRDYLVMLHDVFAECRRKLEPGGRIAVNVANLGRKPYRSLSGDVTGILQDLGLLLRGEIVWRKQAAAGGSCAWGTYQSPANPVLRDLTERVIVASKGRFDRAVPRKAREARGLPHVATISKDEFVDATTDVWEIAAESATRVGHPAPFPVELPRRLIELYTYKDDLVLDPFMGAGSTAVAAAQAGRSYVGFDTDAGYVARAQARVSAAREHGHPPDRARDMALATLQQAGFDAIETGVAFRDLGVSVDFRARRSIAESDTFLFDVAGAISTTRPGLKRADNVWRVLGKAAVLVAAGAPPFVVLSTDLPAPKSPHGRALARMTSPAGPIAAVIELGSAGAGAVERLAALAAAGG